MVAPAERITLWNEVFYLLRNKWNEIQNKEETKAQNNNKVPFLLKGTTDQPTDRPTYHLLSCKHVLPNDWMPWIMFMHGIRRWTVRVHHRPIGIAVYGKLWCIKCERKRQYEL